MIEVLPLSGPLPPFVLPGSRLDLPVAALWPHGESQSLFSDVSYSLSRLLTALRSGIRGLRCSRVVGTEVRRILPMSSWEGL